MYNKIIIAAGTGQIGKALVSYFKDKAEEIVILSRRPKAKNGNVRTVVWDAETPANLWEELEGCEVLINLTGKNVNCRHTSKNKKEILSSRLKSIEALYKAAALCTHPPELWIQASAGAIYGSNQLTPKTEESPVVNDGFMPEVTTLWEKTFWEQTSKLNSTRKVVMRLGVVLGKNEGAFPKLKMLTHFGLGGSAGNGKQYLSWIHIEDVAKIVGFIIAEKTFVGAVNLSAPQALSNSDFMKTLREVLNVPFGLAAPKFALRIGATLLGSEASIILDSMRMVPEKLVSNGYMFQYHDLESALEELKQ